MAAISFGTRAPRRENDLTRGTSSITTDELEYGRLLEETDSELDDVVEEAIVLQKLDESGPFRENAEAIVRTYFADRAIPAPRQRYAAFLHGIDRQVVEGFHLLIYDDAEDTYGVNYEALEHLQDLEPYRFKNVSARIRDASVGRYIFDKNYMHLINLIDDASPDHVQGLGYWFYTMVDETWSDEVQEWENKDFRVNILTLVLGRLRLTSSVRDLLDYVDRDFVRNGANAANTKRFKTLMHQLENLRRFVTGEEEEEEEEDDDNDEEDDEINF